VVPILKKTLVITLNNLRPVALISLPMKAMERVIKNHIINTTNPFMDPLQFTYRAGRGVDDAKIFIMDTIHKHLELPNTSARVLFADFSSAFNTLQPHILAEKLSSPFHLDDQLTLWIIDFLTNRTQTVLVNNTFSDLSITSTGSPQGCIRSLLLFILYTDDCRSTHHPGHLVKCADDTVLLSLISGSLHHHSSVLSEFVHDWCDDVSLELNVENTKDLVVTFSSKQRELSTGAVTTVLGQTVGVVEKYKYLGTIFVCTLKFASNTEDILRRCQQQKYLLRSSTARTSSGPFITPVSTVSSPSPLSAGTSLQVVG